MKHRCHMCRVKEGNRACGKCRCWTCPDCYLQFARTCMQCSQAYRAFAPQLISKRINPRIEP